MKRILGLVLLFVLVPIASPVAAQDSSAVVVNTHDDLDLFRFAFHVHRTMQETVTASNAAVAFSSCSECQSVALAFQVVLILSDPSVVSPENIAIAYNYQCSACETLASAYQWVLTTDGPVVFTPEGQRRLAELRARLQQLRHGDLTIEQIQAEAELIAGELSNILATELTSAGPPPQPDSSPSPSPSAEPSTGPAESPQPSSSPTSSPEPAPSPST